MDEVPVANCPVCYKEKTHKTMQAYTKCKDRSCLSCANSIKLGGPGNKVPSDGTVLCVSCDLRKSVSAFTKRKDGNYYSCCKDCQNIKNKVNFRGKWKFARYGINKNNRIISSLAKTVSAVDAKLKSPSHI